MRYKFNYWVGSLDEHIHINSYKKLKASSIIEYNVVISAWLPPNLAQLQPNMELYKLIY